MDKKLYDGIVETIKCYGLLQIGATKDEIIFSNDTKSVDVLINTDKSIVSIYQKGGLIMGLNEEHLSFVLFQNPH